MLQIRLPNDNGHPIPATLAVRCLLRIAVPPGCYFDPYQLRRLTGIDVSLIVLPMYKTDFTPHPCTINTSLSISGSGHWCDRH